MVPVSTLGLHPKSQSSQAFCLHSILMKIMYVTLTYVATLLTDSHDSLNLGDEMTQGILHVGRVKPCSLSQIGNR